MIAVRIFGPVVSTYTRVVQIVAEEAGLAHEIVPTPAQSAQNRHPFGRVPVVEVDGLELYETVSIAAYIDNAHNGGALQPGEPAARAAMDRWIAIGNNYLFPLFEHGLVMPYVMHRHAGFPLEKARMAKALPAIGRALSFLEVELQKDGAWTAIDRSAGFTLADAFLYPILRSVQLTPEGGAGIARSDFLTAWLGSTAARPSIAATAWETERDGA